MILSEIQSAFSALLNRRDLTPTQTTTFLQFAIQRIQRKLRVPPMEKLVTYTSDGTGLAPIPGDYLQGISLYTNDAVNVQKLVKRDLQTVLKARVIPGSPTCYYMSGSNFMVGPVPKAGTVINIQYYSDASSLSAPTDHNWITDATPTMLIYGMLDYAGDTFVDDRTAAFGARFEKEMAELQEMADQDDLNNASITPMHNSVEW